MRGLRVQRAAVSAGAQHDGGDARGSGRAGRIIPRAEPGGRHDAAVLHQEAEDIADAGSVDQLPSVAEPAPVAELAPIAELACAAAAVRLRFYPIRIDMPAGDVPPVPPLA